MLCVLILKIIFSLESCDDSFTVNNTNICQKRNIWHYYYYEKKQIMENCKNEQLKSHLNQSNSEHLPTEK